MSELEDFGPSPDASASARDWKSVQPRPSDVELRVVTVGSVFESTPQGVFRMDRIRAEHDRFAREDPVGAAVADEIAKACDRLVFGSP